MIACLIAVGQQFGQSGFLCGSDDYCLFQQFYEQRYGFFRLTVADSIEAIVVFKKVDGRAVAVESVESATRPKECASHAFKIERGEVVGRSEFADYKII